MGGRSRRPLWRWRTDKDDSGAALVEFALVLPLLMMIVLGMVSAGIGYNRKISMTHAAREAARYGATLSVAVPGTLDAWLADVYQRVIDESTGTLGAGTPGLSICVAYVHDGGSGEDQTKSLTTGSGYSLGTRCFDDGARPERRVQVSVVRDHEFNALFFTRTLSIGSDAVARYEAFLGAG